MTPLIKVENLSKTYTKRESLFSKSSFCALQPVSFTLEPQTTLAIVGETGSGKSTLAKLLVGAEMPTTGQVFLNGQSLLAGKLKHRCKHIRMIFQDSGTTLNPSLTIGQLLDEPLKLNTKYNIKERDTIIRETLQKVGLLPEHMNFYPHMFSGGQKQRISLARAIILQPQLVILDEALASLDPSLRSQMINLLLDLQEKLGLTYILISHNIGIVRHFSDKMMVLNHGRVVEFGSTESILRNPKHKYTQRLIQIQKFQMIKK